LCYYKKREKPFARNTREKIITIIGDLLDFLILIKAPKNNTKKIINKMNTKKRILLCLND